MPRLHLTQLARTTTLAVVLAGCATAPRAGAGRDTQIEVTLPMPQSQAAAHMQTLFAAQRIVPEQATHSGVVGQVPVELDVEDRAGTRAMVRAALSPLSEDSTRVVLTGELLVPQEGAMPAATIRVANGGHTTYARAARQTWAALERIAAAVRGDSTTPPPQ